MFTKKTFISILLVPFALILTIACSELNDDSSLVSDPGLFKLGEFTDNGLTVIAYSESPLSVGYNEIYLEAHENSVRFDQPHFLFHTMMHMEHHSHTSPFGEPGHIRDKDLDLYKAWAIFTMPGGMAGNWELQITVHDRDHSGFESKGTIEIEVDDSNRVKNFMTEDEERFVLTLIGPSDPEIGLNDLFVGLHKRESMMKYAPVLNADMDFEPWMPSMDHGSSNNVSPVHEENGFYKGQVNFNMTGDWELRFEIESGGEVLGHHTFKLNF